MWEMELVEVVWQDSWRMQRISLLHVDKFIAGRLRPLTPRVSIRATPTSPRSIREAHPLTPMLNDPDWHHAKTDHLPLGFLLICVQPNRLPLLILNHFYTFYTNFISIFFFEKITQKVYWSQSNVTVRWSNYHQRKQT